MFTNIKGRVYTNIEGEINPLIIKGRDENEWINESENKWRKGNYSNW